MGGDAALSGPDLAQGVANDSIGPGEKLLGHANGEAVMLARVGEEYIAIGASCTHYGGPLAEGVIDGTTVRCPWHHACFDLRTGEALRAPALTPAACWRVERRDGRITVTEKIERDPLAPTVRLDSDRGDWPREIVILGAGAAGTAAAEMVRRCGFDGRVTVVDEEQGSPYDRPNLSKDYLAGNAPEEWIPIRSSDVYSEHGIELVRARATQLDVDRKRVELEGQPPLGYDKLLIATGAEPVHLRIPGADAAHVHYLRSLTDSRAIIAAAKLAKRAVVMGSSFIGLEVAASLRARNVEVHVVGPDKVPLERVLGSELGASIRALHEAKGVVFHLQHTAERIDADAVILDDGTRIDADVVVIGIGVRPRLELAERAGLVIDRGVAVNAQLETSVPGIYAAGDIARWPDPHSGERIRVEHWVVAQRQGQTAARNMLGAREAFDFVPFFWSAHYDVSINYVGHAERWDRIEIDGDANQRDVSARFMRGGQLLALATIFRDQESLETELAMEHRA